MPAAKPVLMLLPGLMCDAAVWADQAAVFGADHEVLVPNFSGLDSFDAMAGAALALTDKPFALAGHSMGGRVAMHLTDLAPERILRVALLDTGAHLPTPKEVESRQALMDIADAKGIDALIQAWLPPMIAPHRLDDKVLWDTIAAMQRRAGVETYRGQVRALLARPDGFAELDRIKVPTAFITGRLDGWSPPEQHAEMQAHVPGSTLTVIEDCGHMAPMEAPAAINQALQQWLNQ
jgi:pimeloyl-ACP methyl ester carboxylesterase